MSIGRCTNINGNSNALQRRCNKINDNIIIYKMNECYSHSVIVFSTHSGPLEL